MSALAENSRVGGFSESGASGSANPCDGRKVKVGSIGIPCAG